MRPHSYTQGLARGIWRENPVFVTKEPRAELPDRHLHDLYHRGDDHDEADQACWSSRRGAGLTLALVLMASIREQVDLSDVADVARGSAVIFLVAGFLSLAFMGFAGLLSV